MRAILTTCTLGLFLRLKYGFLTKQHNPLAAKVKACSRLFQKRVAQDGYGVVRQVSHDEVNAHGVSANLDGQVEFSIDFDVAGANSRSDGLTSA